jgi:putative ABC transport system permease protein
MNLIKYAIKNVFRHKISSIVVGISIVFASFIMIVGLSYGDAIRMNMMNNTIKTFLGDVQIHQKTDESLGDKVLSDKSTLKPIDDYNSLISEIKKDEDVQYVVQRVQLAGTVNLNENSAGCVIVGVDPRYEFKMSSHLKVIEGRSLVEGEDGLLLTNKNKKKLGAKIGDMVEVSRVSKDGKVIQVEVPVVGVVEAPGIEPFVSHLVYLNIEDAQKLNNIGDKVSNLVVLLKERSDLDSFMNKWKGPLEDKSLQEDSYKVNGATYMGIAQTFEIAFYSIIFVVFVLIMLYVLNISLMAVYQRVKEIGTLSALGTGSLRIMFSIIFEFLFLGLLASSVGIAGGSILVSVLSKNGIPASSDTMATVYGGDYIYLNLNPQQIIITYAVACVVCFIAVIIPAFRATRIQPIDALRTE